MRTKLEDEVFSRLPEDLIQSIVSLLSIKEAAKTSLVSKQWRFRWTKRLTLDLDLNDIYVGDVPLSGLPIVGEELEVKYVDWVNRVLRSHQGESVETVRISTTLPCECSDDVDRWIRFALDKKVKNLDVNLSKLDSSDCFRRYVIPDWFVSYGGDGSSLRSLSFATVELKRVAFGRFRWLKSLKLSKVEVTQELVNDVMLNCAKLEYFETRKCDGAEAIKFKVSKHLKHLAVSGCVKSFRTIEISDAFSLESVECVGNTIKSCLFKPIPTLKRLSILGGYPNETSGISYVTNELPYNVPNLETLHMSTYSKEIGFNRFIMPTVPSTFNKLRHFVLHNVCGEARRLLKLLTIFMRMMPCLHSLDLSNVYSYWGSTRNIKWTIMKKCTLKYLKVVKITNFIYHQEGVNLILFFLQNATNLEFMEIHRKIRHHSRDGEGRADNSSSDISPKTIEKWFHDNGSFRAKLNVF